MDVSRVDFKYGNFRNIKSFNNTPAGGSYAPGTEPLYDFNATILQVYISMFF